ERSQTNRVVPGARRRALETIRNNSSDWDSKRRGGRRRVTRKRIKMSNQEEKPQRWSLTKVTPRSHLATTDFTRWSCINLLGCDLS
ncbi:uncharacterized protein ACA1_282290, partial [Acanthamoeba castellanii str. Neff]